MDFIPLHLYSGYSFLKSGILFKDLSKDLVKKGYKQVGLTDYNVMYGYPLFNKTLLNNNIKPIFGLDLHVNENLFTLIVKNENGYKNLCYISTYLEKRAGICSDFNEIKDYLGDLICVISSKSSKIFNSVNEHIFLDYLNKLNSLFSDFYIGLEIYSNNDKIKANLINEFSSLYNIKLIAFPFIKYLNKGDELRLKILEAISKDTAIETIDDDISNDYYLRTKEEINTLYDFKYLKELNSLVSKINFNFNVKRGELLNFTSSSNISSKDLLKEEIYKGLAKHHIDIKENKAYRNRLNKEFIIIDKMGYCDYFLIVKDYVDYAKNNNIPVGPGRGSASGSLIAYLLGITEVDPLKFKNLLFERFLNPERQSMPDIDIDFSDLERDKVINYIINKYGKDRTARVIAFQTIGAKQAIRDVGRVFHYNLKDIDELSKAIPVTSKIDLETCAATIPAFKNLISDDKNKELYERAKLIEGFPRQKGLHAAGVIINDKSLLNTLPLTVLDENTYVTQYEKDYLEEQGFLKMDLLGLTALSTIQRTLNLIKINENKEIKMEDIPLNDPLSYKLIREFKTMGIFQLDTGAARNGIRYIKPTSFNDIVDLLALDRPGPMEQIPLYSARKEGRTKVSYLDKSLIPILESTYGIIIYQEQIMEIGRAFAGFSMAESDIFRRAISKKHVDELVKIKAKFFEGAKKLGHNENTINKIYDLILEFASYGFNKSHSVAYSMISVRMAYLKAHYPLEFYASILESQFGNNDTKFANYISEIRRSNIKILNPNINESELYFKIYNSGLLFPLLNIGGLPSKLMINIINERNKNGKFKDFLDFISRMYLTPDKITELQVNKLIDSGAFDLFNYSRASLKAATSLAIQFASTYVYKEKDLLDNFGLSFTIENIKDNPKERMENEFNVLGVLLSDSPFNYIEYDKNIKITPFSELVERKTSTILGIILTVKTLQIRKGIHKGEIMAFVDLNDDNSNSISCTIFSDLYAKNINKLKKDNIVLIKGKLEINSDRKDTFLADEIIVLKENI